MMFQGYALYPHMSVRKNLAYPLRVRRAPRREIAERIEGVARLLGIEPLLDRQIQAISGGEQQRVAIGRAIVQKPDLYLLDEPISNLDASLRESVRSEIRRLQRELGATMIMVTHDQLDALAIADRIAVLRAGTVQQLGDPEDLYQNPANAFVAAFIGQSRMNLLRCRYVGGGAASLQGEGFSFPAPAQMRLPPESRSGELLVGFRPEAATVHRHPTSGAAVATIELVQFQGDRQICMLRLGPQAIYVSFELARTRPRRRGGLAGRGARSASRLRRRGGSTFWADDTGGRRSRAGRMSFSKSWENDDVGGNDAPR